MGEEDIKYYYSTAHTQVFWNLEDYPLPPDFDSIDPNLTLALHRMGFHGSVGIFVYGPEEPKLVINELGKTNIIYSSDRGEESTAAGMCLDIIDWVVSNPYPRSIVVIAKKDPESEFHRVLKCLKSRNHTFFLVEPTQGSLFQSVDSIVNATQDLGGAKPRTGKPHRLPFVTPADTVANDDNDDDDDEGICCYLSE